MFFIIDGIRLIFGENIKILLWFLQNDILGYLKICLFVGYVGMNGLLQVGYYGVFMICIFFFGDQFDNFIVVKYFGMVEILYKEVIIIELVLNVISIVINNVRCE